MARLAFHFVNCFVEKGKTVPLDKFVVDWTKREPVEPGRPVEDDEEEVWSGGADP